MAASTSWSTTRAAQSAAPWSTATTASMTSSAPWQVNYFGALRITMALLPHERAEAWSRHQHQLDWCADQCAPFSAFTLRRRQRWTPGRALRIIGILRSRHYFTTINMPLVKTPMIAPTKILQLTCRRWSRRGRRRGSSRHRLQAGAHRHPPWRVRAGAACVCAPYRAIVMNTSFMFGDSDAAKGKKNEVVGPSADQLALSNLMRGIHF